MAGQLRSPAPPLPPGARPAAGQRRPRRALAPWALAAAVLTGQAMASLDAAIVNVAGPAIQRDLHLSGAALQLAIYSYLLVYAVALVTGARLGGRYGFGRLFGYGIAIFTVSSLACGLAVNPVMLVATRAAQGLGAALLVPQVLSLLQVTFDGERRRRALSLYGMVLAVGVAVGQVLGGVLVSADLLGTGWRPVFLVNVPAGLAVLAFAAGRLPAGGDGEAGRGRLDLAGAGWLGAAILALVVPLTFGASAGWPAWSWPVAAAGVAALAVFARHERALVAAGREPLIDPALLARPGIRRGLAGIFTLHASYGGLLFTTAVYLQDALHDSPLRSGLTFAGYAAGFAIASLTWTRVPSRWQPRLPQAAFAVFAAVTGLLAWLTHGGGWPWQATVLLVIAGAAHGAGFDAIVHRTASGVPAALTDAFSGVLATINQLPMIAGIAIAGTIYLSAAGSAIAPMTAVLIALTAALALTGVGLRVSVRHGRRSGIPAGPGGQGGGPSAG
ncbi:MAG TPA: MFS transporter [Streptosporangiaceae bacterium]